MYVLLFVVYAFAVPLRLFICYFYNYQITSAILISCISTCFLLRIRTRTYRPLK